MIKILLLITCIFCGFGLRRSKFFDEQSAGVLNNLIIYFFIPILTLYHIPKLAFSPALVWLSITPFMVYAGSYLFAKLMRKPLTLERKAEGALIMTAGIGSTSFVGFPIFELLYGDLGLAYGLVLSLAGTFLVFNTVGVATGLYYSDGVENWKTMARKMLSFPPLIAFLLALLIRIIGIDYSATIDELLLKLTAPFSVIALLAIGMQIEIRFDPTFLRLLLVGQLYKLILAPVLIYFFLWYVVGITDVLAKVCVLGAAIGSMNAISIVAAQQRLHPRFAVLMPAIGIPLSIPLLFLLNVLLF